MPTIRHPVTAYRERHGLSLSQLAQRCEPPMHKTQIYRIENGLRKPSFDQIVALVAACENAFTADDLIQATPKSVAA